MGCEHTRGRQAVRERRLAGAATARETAGRGGCRALMGAVLAIAVAGLGASPATGETITLGTFQRTGGYADSTVDSPSETGAKLTWDARASGNTSNDLGLFASLAGGGYTFTNVGDALTYTFTYSGIVMANNLTTPAFRTGFDFGNLAFLYHMTSTGTQPNLGFYANDSGNPFSLGAQVGSTVPDWSPFENQFIRMATGNTIDATVSLTLAAIGASTYDYTYAVTYTGGGDTNTASQAFTGIAANTIDRIFHGANSSGVAVDGNTFTVSNASIVAVPEPGTAVAVVAGLMGLGLLRRRRVGG